MHVGYSTFSNKGYREHVQRSNNISMPFRRGSFGNPNLFVFCLLPHLGQWLEVPLSWPLKPFMPAILHLYSIYSEPLPYSHLASFWLSFLPFGLFLTPWDLLHITQGTFSFFKKETRWEVVLCLWSLILLFSGSINFRFALCIFLIF